MKDDANWGFSEDMKQIIEISKSVITKLGIQNFKIQPSSQKCRILFSITNMGESTVGWSTFPVLIDVEAAFVKIYILFAFEGKTYSFNDPELKVLLINYITLVNCHLKLGMLKYSSSKHYARFENCFSYVFFHRAVWCQMFYFYMANALSSYKAFGFGFVKIVDSTERINVKELSYLYDTCYSRFTGKAPEANQRSRKFEVAETGETDRFFSVNPETLNKICSENVENLFDVSSIERKPDGKLMYDNEKLHDLEFALKKSLKIPALAYKSLKDCLLLLHSKGITFSRLPLSLIKILVFKSAVTEFKLGLKNIDMALSANAVSPSDYSLSIWKQITSFNLSLYLSKACPERQLLKADMIDLKLFAHAKIDDSNQLIGSGGFGTVYSNNICGVDCAVKFASQRKEAQHSSVERLKREYLMMKALRHPSVITVYGCVEYKGRLAYVMQLCNQGTLNEAIKEKRIISYSGKLRILKKIASALNYMHGKQFVHLDIKPHNIFLNDQKPLLGDFGLSASLSHGKAEMRLGCTIYYSPPEQIKSSPPKKSSDVWAFGMTMYQLLLEKHPFSYIRDYRKIEKDNFYTLIKENNERPRFTQEFSKHYPVYVKIMQKCWKLNPSERPTIEAIYLKLLSLSLNNLEIH